MDHSFARKRPRPRQCQIQQQQVGLQKQYNTRSTRRNATTPYSNGVTPPIRIRPPTHSLFFLRLHKLFFPNVDESEGENQNTVEPATSTDFTQILRFGNTRLISIYRSPNIYVVDHFLSVTDIQYLFTHFISKFKFQRSFVDESDHDNGNLADELDGGAGFCKRSAHSNHSPHRTSAFLALNKQHNSRIASMEQKVATLFGCTTKQIEAFQLVRYQSPEQCFHVHHDLGIYDATTGKVELPKKSIWYQRRMITIFCYLNTVSPKNGGATYFPCCTKQNSQKCLEKSVDKLRINRSRSIVDTEDLNAEHQNSQKLDPDFEAQNQGRFGSSGIDQRVVCDNDGLRIYPVAGRAVVFSNILISGVPDPNTIHAGEPVIVPVSRGDTAKYKTAHDKSATKSSELKSNVDRCKTKYGLNIWICES